MKIAKRNIFISLVILTTSMAGCKEDNLIEVSINSKSTEVSLSLLTEVLSTFDIVSDLSSSNVLFLKKDQSLLPNGLIINYIDTTFQDGNGLKIELDFGGLGELPHGQLCKDNKYRAGKMMVAVNRPMSQLDAKLEVSFSEEFPYYTGNGKKMTKLVGQMALLRKSETEITFSIKELKTSLEEEKHMIAANFSVQTLQDGGLGIVNDELSFSGTISVSDSTSALLFSTTNPLIKNYALPCAKYILAGDLVAVLPETNSIMEVDFDPDHDRACDNKVALIVNGKRVIYTY